MVSDGDLTPGANSPRPTLVDSVFWTVFRLLWAATAFCIAAGIALVVLYVLGAWWVGSDLRAAAPRDPVLHHGGAPFFGIVLFASTVAHRASADPVAVIGEVLRVRSWIYYMLGGGASLAAVPLLVTPSSADLPAVATSQYMAIFLAAGFAGGFVYCTGFSSSGSLSLLSLGRSQFGFGRALRDEPRLRQVMGNGLPPRARLSAAAPGARREA
jgi:hypothetical protein